MNKNSNQVATPERLSLKASEPGKDGRFIAHKNGSILDTETNLMWAAKDNGSSINWHDAKNYCTNFRDGGFTDWRMPTMEELSSLYDSEKSKLAQCGDGDIHIATDLIDISCFAVWTSETRQSDEAAALFNFNLRRPVWYTQSHDWRCRALPVRSVKAESHQVAMPMIRPSVSKVREQDKDGRFIAHKNGTILDTETKLMWADKDNGAEIKWQEAKSYCKNYHGGGYSDWRMPTTDELAGLYDKHKSQQPSCTKKDDIRNSIHIATELVGITCIEYWSSETYGGGEYAGYFSFWHGGKGKTTQSGGYARVLPVRDSK